MPLVMLRGWPPWAGTTSTSGRPSGSPWNAIIVWSGDHFGYPGRIAIDVSWKALDPSRSVTQNSNSPARSDRNATRRPSGVRLGVRSLRVDAIATAGGKAAGAPGCAVSTRHTFESAKSARAPAAAHRPAFATRRGRDRPDRRTAAGLACRLSRCQAPSRPPRAENRMSRLSGIQTGLPA